MKKWYVFMIGLLLFEGIADFFSQKWAENSNTWKFAILATLCYMIGNMSWLFCLKHGVGLAKGTVIFSILSTVVTLAIGFIVFKEPLSVQEKVAMGLGLAAVGLFMTA